MKLPDLLNKITQGQHLDVPEAESVMHALMDGSLSPAAMAALLIALKSKGETPQEIAAFARVMREMATDMRIDNIEFVDTCGTGGDGAHTFNISTTAAIIAAAAGCPIAKHGNRNVSSQCGSADVLQALGIRIETEPEKVRQSLSTLGIGFLFAPKMHSAMKHVMPVRRELGVRTVFNLLGPLTNPARAQKQVIGVYRPELCLTFGTILKEMGHTAAYVVHGQPGLDEASISGTTQVVYLHQGELSEFTLSPKDVGLTDAGVQSLQGGSPEDNALIIQDILNGKSGPCRDIACYNAAFAIHLGNKAIDLREGVQLAQTVLDKGLARDLLKRWQKWSTESS